MNPRAMLAAYYVAHTAKSLLWTASDLATIYVLVTLYRIDTAFAGWLFVIGLAANACADWLVGQWLNRRSQDASILAMLGLIAAALCFPATMLAAPHGWTALLAATLVFRTCYAAYDVPHNALLSQLAGTPAGATRLARGRTLGTGVAAALVGLGLWQADDSVALPRILWILSGVSLAGGMMLMPLLRRLPIAPSASGGTSRLALPWRFLAGSLIGIVALSALGKGVLHLPADIQHPGAGAILVWLTIGRTAAALLPVKFADALRGERLLGCLYAGSTIAAAPMLWLGGWFLPVLLGLLLGVTNLVGWAVLPLRASGPRSYGLYTMASKLALGAAGLAMTLALGAHPSFNNAGLITLAAGTATACAVAALLLWRLGERMYGQRSAGAA